MQARMLNYFTRHMCSANIKNKTPIPVFGIEGRYVQALYSAAMQKNELEKVETSFKSLLNIFSKPAINDFIETSIISRGEKAKIILDAAKSASMPETGANFLGIVAENGRLKKLKKMVNIYLSVMVAHRKEAECEVITAEPLDDATRKRLIDAIKRLVKDKESVTITEKVDPSIIGGIIVGIQDKHIDMSISRKLQIYTDILTGSL